MRRLSEHLLRILATLFLAGALADVAFAEDVPRQRVGLVLSGGGARGAAHIGVLEVLEQQRVPVDCIAATSMGALVGGAYAGGLGPTEMRAELARVDWRDLFRDTPDYSEQAYRNKNLAQRFIPGSEIGISERGLRTLPSVIEGQKIKLFLNRLVGSNLGERYIEDLPIPLSIVATDIGNRERVALREGSLSAAMRASMAVPGLLAPLVYEGRKLVDGGLLDNLPVGEVRERCRPDVVIAVNVGSPPLEPEQVGSLLTVLSHTISILTKQNVSKSLAELNPQDVYIAPELAGFTATDFARNAEIADRGKAAAEAVSDRLRGLALSEEHYAAWREGIRFTGPVAPRVDAVEVAGLTYVNPQAALRHIEQRPGEPLDTEKADRDIMRIYGDGYYESVDYALLSEHERHILRVMPVEKTWGKDYLRFGLNLDTTAKVSSYNLRGAYQKTWLDKLGAELLVGAQIGSEPGVFAQFYQPLDARQRFFVQPEMGYSRRNIPVFQDNRRIADYDLDDTRIRLSAGTNISVLGQARLWRTHRRQEASLTTGDPALPESRSRFDEWSLSVDLDQFDRLYFPTRGWTANVNYYEPDGMDYTKVITNLRAARSVGNYVFHGRLYYVDSPRGTLPVYDAESLGGLFNVSGLAPNQIIGDGIRYGGLRAEKIIGQLPIGLRGDMRLGLALEAGKVAHRYTETELSSWVNSGALYLGGETPLGATFIGYGYSPQGLSLLYLFIGTP